LYFAAIVKKRLNLPRSLYEIRALMLREHVPLDQLRAQIDTGRQPPVTRNQMNLID
jgi:hypothetical protein